MGAWINSYGVISPQRTFDTETFPSLTATAAGIRLSCIEPDYRSLMDPQQLRRMPRILKMGLAAARLCLARTPGINPGAIVVGTGLGCLDNLEKFLTDMLTTGEHVRSVLPFINSTHNAVAAQIAMMLGNVGYNLTYSHRSLSFESALQDALMLVREKKDQHVLAGGIDECTDDYMRLHATLGYWKEPLNGMDLFATRTPGTIAGEGSAFFLLSSRQMHADDCLLRDVHTFLAADEHEADRRLGEQCLLFLKRNGMSHEDIGLVVAGMNGDSHFDETYRRLTEGTFKGSVPVAAYKHLCGEYYTSSSFALWMAGRILASRHLPDAVRIRSHNDIDPGRPIRNILLYNHFRNEEHALMLVSGAGDAPDSSLNP